jgi:subtilisin-like proprotein convertase family protein
MAILDAYAPGSTDTINVYGNVCTISSLQVDVDIAHTFIGDFDLVLTSPGGEAVTLHDNTGGATANIVGTYPTTLTVDGPGALADYVGDSFVGGWRLSIMDTVGSDVGTLNSWALRFGCN